MKLLKSSIQRTSDGCNTSINLWGQGSNLLFSAVKVFCALVNVMDCVNFTYCSVEYIKSLLAYYILLHWRTIVFGSYLWNSELRLDCGHYITVKVWQIAVGGQSEGDLLMVCTSQHVCTLDAGRRRHYGAEQADVRQAKISEVGHQ